MDARAIRGWLLCQPRASSLRVSTAGQKEPQTLAIAAGVSWAQIAQSVCALQPEVIEALDAKGQVIRAIRPADVDDEEEEEQPEISAEERTANALMSADPENARLIIFARLISDAYRHATDVAFERLTSLFDAVTRRSEALERSLSTAERLLQKRALEEAETAGAEGGSFEGELMRAFLSGQARKAAADGAVNGKVESK